MKIKLWSIQKKSRWHELNTKGLLTTNEEFADADFKSAYDWLRPQMNERIGLPENPNQYPIWAWFQYENADKKRPDLRNACHFPKGTVGYRLEIEKDSSEVLLSDFELWHFPLSLKRYLGKTETDCDIYERQLKKEFGSDKYSDLPETIKVEIENSWEKIFDMNFQAKDIASPYEEKEIQATFWELKLEEVVKVDRFVAR